MRLRSLLFAPGDDARKLANAFASEADGVIADLEDAVAPERKAEARRRVVDTLQALGGTGPARIVRVNAPDSAWWPDDIAATRDVELDAIVVPKATTDALSRLDTVGPPVIALVETARGLRSAYDIACHPRVDALMLGGADLGAELGWRPRPDGQELLYARSALVVDSAAAGISPPYDVVFLATRDPDGLRAAAAFAGTLGFGGKACIHPAQVSVVNDAFSPSADDVAEATEIVAAYERAQGEGVGVLAVRGGMVDAPVVARARAVLSRVEPGRH